MSASQRASRSKKSVPVFQCPSKKNWSIQEKQILLTSIKRYGVEDVKKLHTCIPSRSEKEIALFIKIRKISRLHAKKQSWKTPIEKWLNLILEMTFYEHEDYSKILSSVMAVIALGECTDSNTATTTASSEEESGQPNYSRMYQYIGALMSGKPPPDLSKIEAAIFVNLMYSLADQLRACQKDATLVKSLLLYKYEMLNRRIAPVNKNDRRKLIKMALENEWPEDNKYGLPVAEEKSFSKQKGTSEKNKKSQSLSKRVVVTDTECEEIVDKRATDQEKSTQEASKDTTVKIKRGKKRLLKSSRTTDQSSDERRNVSFDGSQSEKSNEQPELSPLHPSSSAEVSLDRESEVEDQEEPAEKEFKKPQFFTLNPLCIPLTLLELQKNSKDNS